ncbi:TIGR02444 family protein [Pseudomonas stutzeri]|nr:TIGR02444 family protein [Stutzerimonas stutzeri]
MPQSLWSFAVDLYRCPDVAGLCLKLQDEHGADVCLLLAGLWLESRRLDATPARIAHLQRLAQPWQQTVVAPLRQLRRAWKAPAATDTQLAELRGRLAELELQAERRLLERIEELAADWATNAPAASATTWLEPLAPACRDALQALRVAAGLAGQS